MHSQQLEGLSPLCRETKKSGGAGAKQRYKLKKKLKAIAAGRSPSRPGKKMIDVNPQMSKSNDGGPGGPALPS